MTQVEAAIGIVRFLQYGSASVLLGSASFLLLVLPAGARFASNPKAWLNAFLPFAAGTLVLASAAGLWLQTAVLAGSFTDAAKPETLALVISTMTLGKAAVARIVAGVCAMACLAIAPLPLRAKWGACAIAGAAASISFAWSGHGAATEGPGALIHLTADAAHSLAAATWVGALVAFAAMVVRAQNDPSQAATLQASLSRFSSLGTWLVTIVLLTGLANSWFLAGSDPVRALSTPYGRLLVFKIGAFGGMVLLAAAHRWWLVPALGRWLNGDTVRPGRVLQQLRYTITTELALGLGILAIVSWLGTLEPPAL